MTPSHIAQILGLEVRGQKELDVTAPMSLADAVGVPGAIVWVKVFDDASIETIRGLRGSLLIHPAPTAQAQAVVEKLEQSNALLTTETPRLTFARLLSRLFSHLEVSLPPGIHSSAQIDPSAQIASGVAVGPFCFIGPNVTIGEGSILHPSVTVHSRTVIGRNCIVNSNTVIGTRGFGFVRDERGRLVHFPQIGRVVIGDEVEIQAGCTVCRPGLGETTIGRGSKIDCLCHIGHNAQIGEDCVITACTEIGAGVQIRDRAWLGPNSCSIEGVVVGEDAFVGIGSVLLRDVPRDEIVAGSPAESIEVVRIKRAAIRKLVEQAKEGDK
jgi:UDP-3-O-[3-hydroxymyristoyl] glucosamine N-acyltransferase